MKVILFFAALVSFGISSASAQGRIPTAKDSINVFTKVKGAAYAGQIVQIYGNQGQHQPAVWIIIGREPRRPDVLTEYRFHGGRMISQRVIKEAYTLKLSGPNIPIANVQLDSDALFRLADREATAARLGFDSLDYELRCRELSTEPIWVVNLRAKDNSNVGILFVSAKTGTVVKKLWNKRAAPAVARTDNRQGNVVPVKPAAPLPPTTYKQKKPSLFDRIFSGGR